MDINYCITELIPFSQNSCKMTMVCNGNPYLSYIPMWMINFVTRKMGLSVFKNIIRKSTVKYVGSEFEKKANSEENKEFYRWAKEKIEEYLGNN